jgi:hypothetical protein
MIFMLSAMLKRVVRGTSLGPPASEAAIASAEATLAIRLPDQLRRLYLECDGFRENKGNAEFLFRLDEGDSSLVRITEFLWTEPNLPDLKPFVFFGSSSGDELWGIDIATGKKIVAYSHLMEGQYEVVGTDIVDVWIADFARYEQQH